MHRFSLTCIESAIKVLGNVHISENFEGYCCRCRSMGNSFRCCVCRMARWRCFCTTKPHPMHLPVIPLLTVHGEHALHLRQVLRELCHWRRKSSPQRLLRGWLRGSRQVDGCRCRSLQMAHSCHSTVSRSLHPRLCPPLVKRSRQCLLGFSKSAWIWPQHAVYSRMCSGWCTGISSSWSWQWLQ